MRREMRIGDSEMTFGDDFHVDEASRVLSYSRGWVSDLRSAMLFGGWSPLQDACFWRRSLYDRVGGIDRSLRFAADYDLFLRMALAGKCTYVPLAFSAFRRHAGQKSAAGAGPYRAEREAGAAPRTASPCVIRVASQYPAPDMACPHESACPGRAAALAARRSRRPAGDKTAV